MVPLIWAVAGLALILSEFIVPEFVIFFFGLGALVNAGLIAIIPWLAGSVLWQVIIWLGLSTLSLFGFRRYFAKWFRGRKFVEDDQSELVGQRAPVLEDISPDKPGRIRFGGTSWPAYSLDGTFKAGGEVSIIRRDGMRYLVTGSIPGLPGQPLVEAPEDPGDDSAAADGTDPPRIGE